MGNKPLIGVSGSIEHDESKQHIGRDYLASIAAVGGIPVVLSMDMSLADIGECLEHMNGIMLAGGADADPALFGESPHPALGAVDPLRDQFEMQLLEVARQRDLPVLGICRGAQMMNVARGGTLYQDLQAQYVREPGSGAGQPLVMHNQTALGKYPSHEIRVVTPSRLAACLGKKPLRVNSHHHQAVWKLAPLLVASAYAPDGLIEAIEDPAHPFWIGVQWHPERMYREDPAAIRLLKAFLHAAGD